jgi:hypothetical protein
MDMAAPQVYAEVKETTFAPPEMDDTQTREQ